MDATIAKDLAGKFGIQGFPTLKFFPSATADPVEYQAGRDGRAEGRGAPIVCIRACVRLRVCVCARARALRKRGENDQKSGQDPRRTCTLH